ncbi:radical SAM protein [Vibrio spartinae]|uniref:Molybdenum cofactor biosynthesis protein A n=1 Tax=Vibrio spartinae TaxID=1918945 RepID=A0A1N6MBA9_9VIBR|nr:radical SAM protein [Vibrio spartinae]SIO96739.1 molybdenum cofactor biosynthesis protein A [Vibrio spartinae]
MYDVYCISAGQLTVKKDANVINKKNNYLNYGLLSLTSLIKKSGLSAIQLHGHFSVPREFADYCAKLGIVNTQFPVFISIPSFYAIGWINDFTQILKNELKIREVVIGGRWVIDGEINQLAQLLPYVDKIIDGLGENQISDLLGRKVEHLSRYVPLNYDLVDKRELYQPSIEVSRGCGMKCDFCQERDEKLQPLKSPLMISSEASATLLADDLNPMSPYFEASMFKPTLAWLEELTQQREFHSHTYLWRAESRADTFPLKQIPALAKAGMKVLDLGLESASPTQIKQMGKSKTPERYLSRASNLLEQAQEAGIDVKVNVLLYAGESNKTIDETYKWLEQHRNYIKGVSVGPVLAFGWDNKKSDFIKSLFSLGASVSDENSFTGVTSFNLSASIDHKESLKISKELSRDFMTARDYFDLKSFSYFSRDYTYSDFVQDIKIEKGNYSFDVSRV